MSIYFQTSAIDDTAENKPSKILQNLRILPLKTWQNPKHSANLSPLLAQSPRRIRKDLGRPSDPSAGATALAKGPEVAGSAFAGQGIDRFPNEIVQIASTKMRSGSLKTTRRKSPQRAVQRAANSSGGWPSCLDSVKFRASFFFFEG